MKIDLSDSDVKWLTFPTRRPSDGIQRFFNTYDEAVAYVLQINNTPIEPESSDFYGGPYVIIPCYQPKGQVIQYPPFGS